MDERFTPPPYPPLHIYRVGQKNYPLSVIDEVGHDLRQATREKDNVYVSNLKPDRYQGITRPHDLIIDFGQMPVEEEVVLYLNGWLFPTDASINLAVSQSSQISGYPPLLQVKNKRGDWQTVIDNISFPMGKNKYIILDLTDKFLSQDRQVRIRTTMQIYWDYIFYTVGETKIPINTQSLQPSSANLHYRGFSRMYRKGGRYGPFWFDYNDVSQEPLWRDLTGNYTRYGDVRELLLEPDSKYIIANAGDEITLEFDATAISDLPPGWTRDFIIYTNGWLKDGDLNTASGQTVEPLPFRGMSRYPYGPDETYPEDTDHQSYLKKYNTRKVTSDNLRQPYSKKITYIQKSKAATRLIASLHLEKYGDPHMIKYSFKMLMVVKMIALFSIQLWCQSPLATYSDVTLESGIDFRYNFGDFTYKNILESSGSGVTILDYDNDGDMDLYLLNGTYLEGISDPEGEIFKNTPNQLYRNNGDGTFSDVTEEAGIGNQLWSMAAGAFDYDGDGDVDIYLLNYGPNVFYLNNGNGTFSDITDSLGLAGPDTLNGYTKWSVGVNFWDYDLDGLVDMMVGNFLAFDPLYISPTTPDMMPHPSEYDGQASLLYHQNEDGTFKEITQKLNLYYPHSKCMGLTLFDYDDDGDLDLFQGNDHQMNFLFRNDGNLVFSEVGKMSGVAVNEQGIPTGSMHGSIGDINGDGLIDLLVVDLRYGALYRNMGNGLFTDITESSGVKAGFSGKGAWGAALFDFDNDGDLDIFSTNGLAEELVEQPPLLMENDGTGYFSDVGPKSGPYFKDFRSGRGAAVWDFDNDGDLDIIVSHVDLRATPVLLRNDGGNKNHWLGLTLVGNKGPASAIGTKIITKSGDLEQVMVNQWATSYLSYNDPRLHIGLGNHTILDQIEIHWLGGETEVFEQLEVDRYITIKQGAGIQ